MIIRRATGIGARAELALILLAATLLRCLLFVGFGLGDDPTYVDYASLILNGGYPPLDPVNQYAYRPVLLYLFAGGIRAFGFTDVGVVAPVFVGSIVTVGLVGLFVRKLIGPEAAWGGWLRPADAVRAAQRDPRDDDGARRDSVVPGVCVVRPVPPGRPRAVRRERRVALRRSRRADGGRVSRQDHDSPGAARARPVFRDRVDPRPRDHPPAPGVLRDVRAGVRVHLRRLLREKG